MYFLDGRDTLNLNNNGTVRSYIQSDAGNDVINYVNSNGEVIKSHPMPIHSMNCLYDQEVKMIDAQGNDVMRHMFVIRIPRLVE